MHTVKCTRSAQNRHNILLLYTYTASVHILPGEKEFYLLKNETNNLFNSSFIFKICFLFHLNVKIRKRLTVALYFGQKMESHLMKYREI